MRRAAFQAGRVDEVVAFSLAHGSPFDATVLRVLLLQLTSDPNGVLLLEDDRGLRLAGVVVDRPQNGADAATLEITGVAETIPREIFASEVLAPAIAFAKAGVRRGLHAPVYADWAPIDGAVETLRSAGFRPCYELFQMRRPAAPAAEPTPLEAGWRWEALDPRRADEAHAVLSEAFRGAMGTGIVPLEEFRRLVASRAVRWHVLLDHETIAALTRVAIRDSHGDIQIVARAPGYRGRGLGDRLIAYALRLLLADGARPVELEVEAANERALALYRRFGFDVVSSVPVLALELGLRPAGSSATS